MKVAVVVALVAACLATSYALPARKVVDWAAVKTSVNDIAILCSNSAEQVKTRANADNAVVGAAIGAKVDFALAQANALLQQVHAAIDAQTLTGEQARLLVGQVRSGMGQLLGALNADLPLLTVPAAVEIRGYFHLLFDELDVRSEALYALFPAEAAIQVVDWSAVEAAVEDIATVPRDTFQQVKNSANNANPIVGEAVAVKVDAAAANATLILEQVNAAVAAQTLTETEAKAFEEELLATMGRLVGALEPELAQLLPIDAVAIRTLIHASFDAVKLKSEVLFALLRV